MKMKGLEVIDVSIQSIYSQWIGPGSRLIKLGRKSIKDILDVYYYHDTAATAVFEVCDELIRIPVDDDFLSDIEFAPMDIRLCANDCVFCFVEQMPKGFRKSLYVKDDDYRFSFLHGSYITLTNLRQKDLNRIRDYHLSPLYLTLNSFSKKVRARLMGEHAGNVDIHRILRLFLKWGIEIYAQFVICPGYNDRDDLWHSLEILQKYEPIIRAVGCVPVGLTRFQRHSDLSPVSSQYARAFIDEYSRKRCSLNYEGRLQLADEWFMKALRPIPEAAYYETDRCEEYPLLENGIGMVRSFIEEIKAALKDIELANYRKSIAVLTSVSAAPMWSIIQEIINKKIDCTIDVYPVENRFFGSSVTVSGLLTGQDVERAVTLIDEKEFLISENCLRNGSKFLDEVQLEAIIKLSGKDIHVIEDGYAFVSFLAKESACTTNP